MRRSTTLPTNVMRGPTSTIFIVGLMALMAPKSRGCPQPSRLQAVVRLVRFLGAPEAHPVASVLCSLRLLETVLDRRTSALRVVDVDDRKVGRPNDLVARANSHGARNRITHPTLHGVHS